MKAAHKISRTVSCHLVAATHPQFTNLVSNFPMSTGFTETKLDLLCVLWVTGDILSLFPGFRGRWIYGSCGGATDCWCCCRSLHTGITLSQLHLFRSLCSDYCFTMTAGLCSNALKYMYLSRECVNWMNTSGLGV